MGAAAHTRTTRIGLPHIQRCEQFVCPAENVAICTWRHPLLEARNVWTRDGLVMLGLGGGAAMMAVSAWTKKFKSNSCDVRIGATRRNVVACDKCRWLVGARGRTRALGACRQVSHSLGIVDQGLSSSPAWAGGRVQGPVLLRIGAPRGGD